MNVLEKWNPFRFERSATKPSTAVAEPTGSTNETLYRPIRAMEDEFSRMVEKFWKEPLPGFADLSPWFGDFRPSLFRPVIDVTDEGDTLEVTAEMPGMDKSDLEISVDEGVLVLRGEKKHRTEKREKGCYRLERSFGNFRRNIPLPADVDLENAEASFDKGILKIHFKKLAKTQKEAPKKIAIKT
jgi:HSP20 family protein